MSFEAPPNFPKTIKFCYNGYPVCSELLLQKCQNGFDEKMIHHLFRIAYEEKEKEDVTLPKRCQECLYKQTHLLQTNPSQEKQKRSQTDLRKCFAILTHYLYFYGNNT